jgi:hypothetical protein
MIRLQYIIFLFLVCTGSRALCQDTLPKISVKNVSNKIIVSWKNNYGGNISTINIQRSYDSIKNFTTIGSVLEPMNKDNGFVDNKEATAYVFYRVFIAFEGGRYLFSKSYRPVKDSTTGSTSLPPANENKTDNNPSPVEAIITVPSSYSKAIAGITPGTKLYRVPPPLPLPPPPAPKNLFTASKFIYTGKDNNIIIDLAMTPVNHFSAKFYDDKDNLIFEVKKLTEPYLIIEKVNFKHAGWFYFKLFDNGILKEKNQFYIPKEGKSGIPPNEMNKPIK